VRLLSGSLTSFTPLSTSVLRIGSNHAITPIGSCFSGDGFTRLGEPAPAPPQALVTVELTAQSTKFIAAFKSLSMACPHWSQTNMRSDRHRLSLTVPQREQVFDEGNQPESHRLPQTPTPEYAHSSQHLHHPQACSSWPGPSVRASSTSVNTSLVFRYAIV